LTAQSFWWAARTRRGKSSTSTDTCAPESEQHGDYAGLSILGYRAYEVRWTYELDVHHVARLHCGSDHLVGVADRSVAHLHTDAERPAERDCRRRAAVSLLGRALRSVGPHRDGSELCPSRQGWAWIGCGLRRALRCRPGSRLVVAGVLPELDGPTAHPDTETRGRPRWWRPRGNGRHRGQVSAPEQTGHLVCCSQAIPAHCRGYRPAQLRRGPGYRRSCAGRYRSEEHTSELQSL